MTTQKSFSNSNFLPCLKETLWRNKSIGILYFALSFIFLPVQFILQLVNIYKYQLHMDEFFNPNSFFMGDSVTFTGFSYPMFYVLTIGFAFAIPLAMLSYMHNKRSVDLFHSLPYKRKELLGANIVTGLIYMLLSLIINFSVIALINAFIPFGQPLKSLQEMLYFIVPIVGVFAISTLTAVMVGTGFDSFLFSAGLNVVPLILYGIFVGLGETFLLGFDSTPLAYTVNVASLSPALLPFARDVFSRIPITGEQLLKIIIQNGAWLIISAGLFIISFIAYERRKSEQAETPTEKGPLSFILRITGTLAGGLLLGAVFVLTFSGGSTNLKPVVMLTGVFAASIIVYLVGDIIISKRMRNAKKAFAPSLIFALAVCLLLSVYIFDMAGFAKKIPDIEDIEGIKLTTSRYDYDGIFGNQPKRKDRENNIYESPEMIELIHSYHAEQIEAIEKSGVRNALEFNEIRQDFASFSKITYLTKDGKSLTRNYYRPIAEDADLIYKIQTCPEFVEKNHPVFEIEAKDVASVKSINITGSKLKNIPLTEGQKETLLLACRADMLSNEGRNILDNKPLGKIIFFVDEKVFRTEQELKSMYANDLEPSYLQVSVAVNDGFANTLMFLESLNHDFSNGTDDIIEAYISEPDYYNNNVIRSVNYNNNRGYNENGLALLTKEETEAIFPHLKAFCLNSRPFLSVQFYTGTSGIREIYDISPTETTIVEYDNGYAVPTAESSDGKEFSAYGYIAYEDVPESVKYKYWKEFAYEHLYFLEDGKIPESMKDDQFLDLWFLRRTGFTEEFVLEELQRFDILKLD